MLYLNFKPNLSPFFAFSLQTSTHSCHRTSVWGSQPFDTGASPFSESCLRRNWCGGMVCCTTSRMMPRRSTITYLSRCKTQGLGTLLDFFYLTDRLVEEWNFICPSKTSVPMMSLSPQSPNVSSDCYIRIGVMTTVLCPTFLTRWPLTFSGPFGIINPRADCSPLGPSGPSQSITVITSDTWLLPITRLQT